MYLPAAFLSEQSFPFHAQAAHFGSPRHAAQHADHEAAGFGGERSNACGIEKPRLGGGQGAPAGGGGAGAAAPGDWIAAGQSGLKSVTCCEPWQSNWWYELSPESRTTAGERVKEVGGGR